MIQRDQNIQDFEGRPIESINQTTDVMLSWIYSCIHCIKPNETNLPTKTKFTKARAKITALVV